MASSDKLTTVQVKHSPDARLINMKMMQNVLLIWLDANISESSSDCQNTITHLRRVMNTISTFTDNDQCIQFLEQVEDEKVSMIISGSLGEHIVPRVHDMTQVDSIFIFCSNKQYHEQWAKAWFKVKGVYTDIQLICDALKQSAKDCEQNAIGFSVVATGGDFSNLNLDRLDPMFMYTQIIKEILLGIQFKRTHLLNFTTYCREMLEDNEQELNNVDKLEQNYHKKKPIWWYKWESFLYPMLNRALCLSDMNVIVKMGFFIGDLHRQIEKLHKEQYSGLNADKQFTVYRGQGIFNEEFEKISKTKDGLIAFNNLLSASRTESVPIDFVKRALLNPEMVGVLFEMNIHPKQSTASFASVAAMIAYGNNEDEILFAMHTVFRIREIQQMAENTRLYRVKLELTSQNDKDLQMLTKHIREETFPNEKGWDRLGLVLSKSGKPRQAEEIYQILFKQEFDERQMAYLYNRLGFCKYDQVEYDEAIRLYENSIAIYKNYFPNSPDLAKCYNNIGVVYYNMGEFAKAVSSYEKALAIQQQSISSNHCDLTKSYNNIGLMYKYMGEFAKALSYYEKALVIKKQSCPFNYSDLAMSYNNIGLMYRYMGEYAKALSSYEISLVVQQQVFPPNQSDLAMSCNNIGMVYENMREYAKALSYYEKALAIQQQSRRPNHSDLAKSYNNIGIIYRKMREYSKALSFYEKVLEIKQQSLLPNHLDLAKSYNNIGVIYDNMKNHSEAYSFYEKAVRIAEESLHMNHPHRKIYKNNLEDVKKRL